MINEQENKTSLKAMSDLEYAKNDTEMMRYRVNGLSNKLGLAAMGFSLFAAFICLNSMRANNFQVILIILMNIVILLGGFLSAEKSKNYVKTGAIAQVVFGGICFARIFYMPLIIMIKYNEYKNSLFQNAYATAQANAEGISAEAKAEWEAIAKNWSNVTADLKKNWLGEPIISADSGGRANRILPADGNFRAILSIVLLATAAALFITAGIIGYIRAKKLATYLSSLNEKK